MKYTDESGNTKYYYYKKKIGRHKKRGARKKKKLRGRRWQEPWNFKIILCNNKKQSKYLGVFHNTEEVEYVKNILLEKNKNVVFPKLYVNNGRNSKHIEEVELEYVVLKKIRNKEIEPSVTRLRNQYGTFVEHKTTSENWAVYDKFPCVLEETFWVYGKNPKTDRKSFGWIFDNLVVDHAEEKNDIVMIYVYNNKVIFKYEDNFEFVICKNVSDAIRMYNLLEEKTKRARNVIMTGATNTRDGRGKVTIDMLSDKTGWTRRKITSKTTRS